MTHRALRAVDDDAPARCTNSKVVKFVFDASVRDSKKKEKSMSSLCLAPAAPAHCNARKPSHARRRTRAHSALDDVRFVLCRPEGPTNVGSAARACQNFGVRDFKIVDAAPSVVRDDGTIDEEARKYAVHASWMLDGAVEKDIASACADRTFVVATTARPRENVPLLSLREGVRRIREEIANGARVVVLFGNERTGLTNEELTYANVGVKVPTAGDRAASDGDASTASLTSKKYTGGSGASSGTGALTPVSLNLGMCVGVVAYELFNQLNEDDVGDFREYKSHQLTVFEKKRLIEDLIAARHAVDVLAGDGGDGDTVELEEEERIYREKEARQIARVLSGTIPSRDAVSFFFLARRILAIARYAKIDDAVLDAAKEALKVNPDAGAKKINAAVQNALDIKLTQRELDRVLAAVRRT